MLLHLQLPEILIKLFAKRGIYISNLLRLQANLHSYRAACSLLQSRPPWRLSFRISPFRQKYMLQFFLPAKNRPFIS